MLVVAIGGRSSLAVAQCVGYAMCAVGVSIGTARFLAGRGVSPAQVWCWRSDGSNAEATPWWMQRYLAVDRAGALWLLSGVGGGVFLALFAHIYLLVIGLVPSVAEAIHASKLHMQSIWGMNTAYAVIAIGFAPFAEEYLFRGLVFQALDREWGG